MRGAGCGSGGWQLGHSQLCCHTPQRLYLAPYQVLRRELDAVAAGGDLGALAATLLYTLDPKLRNFKTLQALRKELDAVAAGGDLEALAAGDGGLSAGTFGANHDAANEARWAPPAAACAAS